MNCRSYARRSGFPIPFSAQRGGFASKSCAGSTWQRWASSQAWSTLGDKGISVFALSTFNTDYLLVPEVQSEDAISALEAAGHRIEH